MLCCLVAAVLFSLSSYEAVWVSDSVKAQKILNRGHRQSGSAALISHESSWAQQMDVVLRL